MNFTKLTHDELRVGEVVDLVKSSDCGAISLFVGTTRDNFDGLKVKCLQYDAYEGMALKEMEKICSDMRKKWTSIVNIAIFHRLGEVKISESSVVIAVSSPHRRESLDGVNYALNALKANVPIWKKEEYEDAPGTWKVNKECSWGHSSNISKQV